MNLAVFLNPISVGQTLLADSIRSAGIVSAPNGRLGSILYHISRLTQLVTGLTATAAAVIGQHELVDKVDNGAGRLVRIQLSKHVALITSGLCGPSSNKSKQPGSGCSGGQITAAVSCSCTSFLYVPAAVLRIKAAVGDLAGGEVFAEKQPPGLVCQGYTLT